MQSSASEHVIPTVQSTCHGLTCQHFAPVYVLVLAACQKASLYIQLVFTHPHGACRPAETIKVLNSAYKESSPKPVSDSTSPVKPPSAAGSNTSPPSPSFADLLKQKAWVADGTIADAKPLAAAAAAEVKQKPAPPPCAWGKPPTGVSKQPAAAKPVVPGFTVGPSSTLPAPPVSSVQLSHASEHALGVAPAAAPCSLTRQPQAAHTPPTNPPAMLTNQPVRPDPALNPTALPSAASAPTPTATPTQARYIPPMPPGYNTPTPGPTPPPTAHPRQAE